MPNYSTTSTPPELPISADDPSRRLTITFPEDAQARHFSLVGHTYTILLSGADMDGRRDVARDSAAGNRREQLLDEADGVVSAVALISVPRPGS